jgi:hypothetical protein
VSQNHRWLKSLRTIFREGNDKLAPFDQDFDTVSLNASDPGPLVVPAQVGVPKKVPQVDISFNTREPWSGYNWETFFHAPLLVATQLSKNQRFEEAQRWFHLIFDPTTTDAGVETVRYWKFKPFRDAGRGESIEEMLHALAQGNPSLGEEIEAWKKSPFQPHLIARMRIRAYQFAVILKYLENLIAWGDQLFRRDTIESINEATQLYVLAAKILGRRPASIPHDQTIGALTYRELEDSRHKRKLDEFSNVWLDLESLMASGIAPSGTTPSDGEASQILSSLKSLYFCVPNNEKLMSYWDKVEDRFFKIRNCMNIDGVVRQLPLFEPPIDPALLVKAAAAGLDLETVLSDRYVPLPKYRFNLMLQKALELAGELRSMGASLLSALEKGEAEHLALLRSSHEIEMLNLVKSVREQQEQEAEANLVSLRQSRQTIEERYRHYQRLLGKTEIVVPPEGQMGSLEILQLRLARRSIWDEENGLGMIQPEQDQLARLSEAQVFSVISSASQTAASVITLTARWLPEDWQEGLRIAGDSANFAGQASGMMSSYASQWAQRSSIIAGYERRRDDWVLQSNLAIRELAQIDKQIIATEIRRDIAKKELDNHLQQIENAQEVDAYMRGKFTNEQLYRWMVGEISGLYFRTYQLAYDIARRAQLAYEFELGVINTSFVQYGYWDSLRKGLLSGEKLYHDLKRMDLSYLERNNREYEITQHISVLQLNPGALIALRQTGSCEVKIPEAFFDLYYPGHYLRRIKSVSLSIPCVSGPYASVNCTLTLLKSSVRYQTNGSYERQQPDDLRFVDDLRQQSIVTSSGQNDSGLFETNLRDERYLPFEGSGADSTWRIELPNDFRQFDYDTIADVILHLRYTAQEGGIPLRNGSTAALKKALKESADLPLMRAFSLRHEFPTDWHRFLNSYTADFGQSQKFEFRKEHFSFLFKTAEIQISKIEIFVKAAHDYLATYREPEKALQVALQSGGVDPLKHDDRAADFLTLNKALQGLLVTEKPFANISVGELTLQVWHQEPPKHPEKTIEDIVILCHFNITDRSGLP